MEKCRVLEVRVAVPDGEGRFGPNETLVLCLQTWQGRPFNRGQSVHGHDLDNRLLGSDQASVS